MESEVGSASATLSLILDLDAVRAKPEREHYLGEGETQYERPPAPPRTPANVGALLATFSTLGVLSASAVANNTSLVALVGDIASVGPSDYSEETLDISWSVRREWPRLRRKATGPEMRFERWPELGVTPEPITVVRLSLGSPLDAVLSLPWGWFAAGGGGMVFIKAVEYWLNSPGRIRAEHARLAAEEARHEADRAEARRRELNALKDIGALFDRPAGHKRRIAGIRLAATRPRSMSLPTSAT